MRSGNEDDPFFRHLLSERIFDLNGVLLAETVSVRYCYDPSVIILFFRFFQNYRNA